MKFLIVLFLNVGPGVMEIKGFTTVDTQDQCVQKAYEINLDKSVPFVAACIPQKEDKI